MIRMEGLGFTLTNQLVLAAKPAAAAGGAADVDAADKVTEKTIIFRASFDEFGAHNEPSSKGL